MKIEMGEFITLSMLALALGMDAFSASLGIGMVPIRLKKIFYIGLIVGGFHVSLPLLGILIGRFVTETFGEIAALVGGLLLIIAGSQMIIAFFQKQEEEKVVPSGWQLLLFALIVSLDSFSVGLTLGIYGAKVLLVLFLFGSMSTGLTWSGLLIGKKVGKWFGAYSEAFGGCVLLAFGLKLLFL
ncbi:manganese efflux pump MntP family protein [Bacillus sp. B190/17]|uniref:Putative manganese efflux pump MntP n=1 Tax=Bacillus lumedeiriae TaxID=3058829 RepID=A0ABW8IAC6_9BACI